jgi:hypothetical protein
MTELARDPLGLRSVSPLLIGTLLNPGQLAAVKRDAWGRA